MKENLILIGGGGHCKSCIDVIEQEDRYRIVGIVDSSEKIGRKVLGYPIIACDADLPELAQTYRSFFITLGQIKTNEHRVQLFTALKALGADLPVMVSPKAHVSPHAVIGEGTIVMHFAMINAAARIGCNCIVNSGAVVEHDSVIGSCCHISTGAVVNGDACIGAHVFIGSQAMVKEGIDIGEHSTIGGGVRVLRDVPPGSMLKA